MTLTEASAWPAGTGRFIRNHEPRAILYGGCGRSEFRCSPRVEVRRCRPVSWWAVSIDGFRRSQRLPRRPLAGTKGGSGRYRAPADRGSTARFSSRTVSRIGGVKALRGGATFISCTPQKRLRPLSKVGSAATTASISPTTARPLGTSRTASEESASYAVVSRAIMSRRHVVTMWSRAMCRSSMGP